MSPFIPNYQSQTAELIRQDGQKKEEGRAASNRRKNLMDSDDPAVRKQASGNLGRLSGIATNPRIAKKNSFCG